MGSLAVSLHESAGFLPSTMLAGSSHQVEQPVNAPFYPPQDSQPSANVPSSPSDGASKKAPAPSAATPPSRPTRATDSSSASQSSSSSPTPPTRHPTSTSAMSASTQQSTPQPARRNATPTIVSSPSSSTPSSPASSQAPRSPGPNQIHQPPRVKVKNLQHIQDFAKEQRGPDNANEAARRSANTDSQLPQYEISDMPVADVIEMVAGLLTKITTTNDTQAEHLHRNMPTADMAAGLSVHASSVLAFHGKNVPTISILSYLSRIHKYCPTTYEVFLSLLVYFDRITEKVNASPMQSLRQASRGPADPHETPAPPVDGSKDQDVSGIAPRQTSTPPFSTSPTEAKPSHQTSPTSPSLQSPPSSPDFGPSPLSLAHFFVVDSYNIHRLVIAGVTCASKFFSDIFYTNSRYAKVGGLPLVELNHLELQFLVLNDFRLSIQAEELEAYATMLVEFYAREVVAQKKGQDEMEGVETQHD